MANKDPHTVGGPGQMGAYIDYPVHQNSGNVMYNYKDTVNVEWFSYSANATETTMQLWYWTSEMAQGDPWQGLPIHVVPTNGTLTFNLNDVPKIEGGWYLGQWNLNFTRTDNAPTRGLTFSQTFNCTFDDDKAATSWGPPGAATVFPSAYPTVASSVLFAPASTATPTAKAQTTSSSASSTPSSSASASASPTSGVLNANQAASPSATTTVGTSSGPSGGAIAGIVIAVLAALALGALGAFLFLRRKKRAQQPDFPPTGPPPYAQYQSHGSMNGQYGSADAYNNAYKQQVGGYPAAPVAAYVPHDAKSHYVAQQQEQHYHQQSYAQQMHQQQLAQQEQHVGGRYGHGQVNGFASELPGVQPVTQELSAERYS